MPHFMKMPFTAIAIMALSACAAGEAPAAEPSSDTAEQSADETAPSPETTAPAEQGQRITITGFECGDNCYLDYRPLASPDAETLGALCSVDLCADWFGDQAMPPEFIGRTATINVKLGKQYDNEGTVMSDDFPEIVSLVLDGE